MISEFESSSAAIATDTELIKYRPTKLDLQLFR